MFLLFFHAEIFKQSSPTLLILYGSGVLTDEAKNDPFFKQILKVEIKDSIETLGASCFYQNPTLEEVILADSVKIIESEAFSTCGKLKSINLGNSITSIGSKSFYQCSSLLTIAFPASIASLGVDTFAYTTKLDKAIFPKNAPIIDIPRTCFYFSGITQLNTSDFTEKIDDQAIRSSKVTIIYLGKAMKTINNWALGNIEIDAIDIHPENTFFKVVDSLLLSLDGSILHSVLTYYNEKPLVMPDTVTVMEGFAYQVINCTSIQFSSKLARVAQRAFQRSYQPSIISFPPSLRHIEQYCFEGSKISMVILPEGLEKLDVGAFSTMINLDHVYIPSTVTDMAGGVFSGSPHLKNFSISPLNPSYKFQDGLIYGPLYHEILGILASQTFVPTFNQDTIKIGSQAFQGCGLTDITIPYGIVEIGEYGFRRSSFKIIKLPASIKILHGNVFYESQIVSFSIEDNSNLEQCGSGQFSLCEKLETVNFGLNCQLNSLQSNHFSFCRSLKTVLNLQKVTRVQENGCVQCNSLELIEINWNSMAKIGNNAFSGCNSLVSVTIQGNCELGKSLFVGAEKLQTLSLNIKNIAESSFLKIKGLEILNLGENVEIISYFSFSECFKLREINFNDNIQIQTISSFAFGNCISLTRVILPSSINKITAMTFSKCSKLMDISVKSEVNYASVEGVLYSLNKEILILCPNGRQSIEMKTSTIILGEGSFYGCDNIESVMISPRITNISSYCFFECSKLKRINLPATIQFIGESAFWQTSLNLVMFCSTDSSKIITEGIVFESDKINLIVPQEYNGTTLFEKKVIRSNSIRQDGCPNPPTEFFTMKKTRNWSKLNELMLKILMIFPIFKINF